MYRKKKASGLRTIQKTLEFKLYLSKTEEDTLESWLGACCWTYNQMLEMRTKAYKRRKESIGFVRQCEILKDWRAHIPMLTPVPVVFLRDSLRRLDRGMDAFFRRLKAGEKPGYPRFRAHHRYRSMEYLHHGNYIHDGAIRIPVLGEVTARGMFDTGPIAKQLLLRVIHRASGWYAQVVIDTGIQIPEKIPVESLQTSTGLDVGLTTFAVLANGDKIENPRFYRKSERKLKHLHKQVSRKQKGSRNRRKAVRRLARHYERIQAQRRDFAHQTARRLVNQYNLIGFENLNIRGMCRSPLAKSIHDAAWGSFLRLLTSKAANAGRHAIGVNARYTSQDCPACGARKYKSLNERLHNCPCGLCCERDRASGMVIHARALRVVGANCGGIGLCRTGHTSGEVSRSDETGSPKSPTRCKDTTRQRIVRTLPHDGSGGSSGGNLTRVALASGAHGAYSAPAVRHRSR